jgi:hypothetical protein
MLILVLVLLLVIELKIRDQKPAAIASGLRFRGVDAIRDSRIGALYQREAPCASLSVIGYQLIWGATGLRRRRPRADRVTTFAKAPARQESLRSRDGTCSRVCYARALHLISEFSVTVVNRAACHAGLRLARVLIRV